MKIKDTFIIPMMLVVIILFSILLCMEKIQNQKLIKKNETLIEMLNFERYGEIQLVPCSICKHKVNISEVNNKYYIRCSECGFETITYEKVQDVINEWNSINNSRQN